MTKINFSRIAFPVLIMLVLLPLKSWAQDAVNSYKVGERVEYNDNPYKPVWYEGTVVSLYPPSNQVVIRWDPRADSPTYTRNGVSIYEAGYNIDRVRHIKAGIVTKPEDKKAGPDPTVKPADNTKTDKRGTADGKGLMTPAEILGYMRKNAFVNGVAKYDKKVCLDLVEQIKLRGVERRIEVYKDDLSPIYGNGCDGDGDVVNATQYNVGPPTTVDWLLGTWRLGKASADIHVTPGDGNVYRKEGTYGGGHSLTINGNGSYTWKPKGENSVQGTWRNATKKEMDFQGGAGIVLLKGFLGHDWIVRKDMLAGLGKDPGQQIYVGNLEAWGGERWFGAR